MGVNYEMVCDQCKVRLFMARHMRSEPESFYLRGGHLAFPTADYRDNYSSLAEFLFKHESHPLRMLSEHTQAEQQDAELDSWTYAELEDKPGLPLEPVWQEAE